MRTLFITLVALSAALTSIADTTVFKWDGVPYTPLDRHTSITVDGLQISFSDDGWISYQQTGQLALQPAQHGDIATLTLAWATPVQNAAITLAGLMHGNFIHAVSAAFTLGGQAVSHESVNLHSVQEQGGWLSNIVQWSHDGCATIVADGAVDRVTLSFTTRPGTSAAAPYYSAILLPQITWVAVPEPSHIATLIIGGLFGLLVVRHIIRRYR